MSFVRLRRINQRLRRAHTNRAPTTMPREVFSYASQSRLQVVTSTSCRIVTAFVWVVCSHSPPMVNLVPSDKILNSSDGLIKKNENFLIKSPLINFLDKIITVCCCNFKFLTVYHFKKDSRSELLRKTRAEWRLSRRACKSGPSKWWSRLTTGDSIWARRWTPKAWSSCKATAMIKSRRTLSSSRMVLRRRSSKQREIHTVFRKRREKKII